MNATTVSECGPRSSSRTGHVLALAGLAAMNIYLLSPVLLYELGLSAGREGRPDKIALFAVPASILWLILVQLTRRPWIVHACLFPFYFLVGVDLYLITHYDTRLTSSTIAVILENWANAGDFLRSHAETVLLWTSAVVAFHVLGVLTIRRLTLPVFKRGRVVVAVALLGLYGAVIARQTKVHNKLYGGVMDVVAHDRSSPFGVFAQGFIAFRVYRDVLEHRRTASSFVFGATRGYIPPEPELFVLVIGESSRRDHWGLYGYPRNTTPRLAGEPNLVAFSDVLSQAALTQIAVPLLLSRDSIDSTQRRPGEASVVSLFNEIGFTTHWLSTQQRDHYTGAINRCSSEASEARFLDRHYDGALVKLLKSTAEGDGATAKKRFVVLHTMGSHSVFEDRCPQELRAFPTGAGLSAQERMINVYDNSIYYTDHVLAELLDVLKRQAGVTAMVYVADHGENLKDDERALFGHFFNNEYDLPIPMLFWYSDAFAERYPEKVAAARGNAGKRINTRAVFYTAADLADAVLDDPNLSTLSLLHPGFTPVPRMVLSRWISFDRQESVDFDEQRRRKRSAAESGTTGSVEPDSVFTNAPSAAPHERAR